MKFCEMHAREKSGMAPEWAAYRWKCMPPNGEAILYYEVTGVVAPLKKVGEHKGFPNWRKGSKETNRTVILPIREHQQWIIDWVKKTGNCYHCLGEGKVVKRWTAATGTEYKPCTACKETGKSTDVTELEKQLLL